jgi:hypothetical protein
MPDQTHLFFDAATLDFPIVDSDAHVNEPPDLWQKRRQDPQALKAIDCRR